MKWFVAVALVAGWLLLLPLVLHAEKYLSTSNKPDNKEARDKEAERLRKAAERDDKRSVERQVGKNVKASLKDLPARTWVSAELSWPRQVISFAYSLLHRLPIDSTARAAQGSP